MASKFLVATLRPWTITSKAVVLAQKPSLLLQTINIRRSGGLIPPSQYDTPFPKKMKIGTVLYKNWEIIPLFVVTMTSVALTFFAIFWSARNKVDVIYKPRLKRHTRISTNISRKMDLRKPTVHKLLIFDQKYDPWPELHDLLVKLDKADCNTTLRESACIKQRVKKFHKCEIDKMEGREI